MNSSTSKKFIEVPANKQSVVHRKPIFGVGINDADYTISQIIDGKATRCPYYTKWMSMILRCFSKKIHERQPTYMNCTIEKEWLTFSNFKSWMEKQDWHGKELDKDILLPGNKHYSSSTCVFISKKLNTLLTDCKSNRGKFPRGVSLNKNNNKFQVKCWVAGEQKYLGYFDSSEEAGKVYSKFKSNYITEMACQQDDSRIKEGLLLHASIIRNQKHLITNKRNK